MSSTGKFVDANHASMRIDRECLHDATFNESAEEQLEKLTPGGFLHYDYRTPMAKEKRLPDQFHVVQWNIERGIQWDRVKDTFRALKADILILQELDINCRRSGYRNVAKELAKALEMEVYFLCEFEELDSTLRSPKNAVGPLSQPTLHLDSRSGNSGAGGISGQRRGQRHFHGNAILSSVATLSNVTAIPHYVGLDWEKHGVKLREPRCGFRYFMRCCIKSCERENVSMPDLYLYSCHFEIFCGVLGRARQLVDVLRDANALLKESEGMDQQPAFVLGGDLNTVVYGVVRLSKTVANDRMRFLSIGEKESCWLQRKILSRGMQWVDSAEPASQLSNIVSTLRRLYNRVINSDTMYRLLYGFSPEELEAMDNKSLCFYDPSDKVRSVTLDNPDFYGFVKGKLDWTLLSNVRVLPPELPEDIVHRLQESGSITSSSAESLRSGQPVPDGYVLFNEDFSASDHKGLLIHLMQNPGKSTETYPGDTTFRITPVSNVMFLSFLWITLWLVVAVFARSIINRNL
ncbi:hypothetical protein, conserved [Trypanosoma brucei brucei TREU927]|uniref:Uncharacterized protein n=1 Tax=Trypanosoma brucei brucei (strain 927/4 GUTat10.1) TaxID=185431 RepID=Q38BM4_TRYB2|nr:hypothetical protein, conserved [Trypanosoma brucei brucei TREU927]EAN77796.1 hypothetical protein, conserved [Trypanosoma brucei brucei TREU927]